VNELNLTTWGFGLRDPGAASFLLGRDLLSARRAAFALFLDLQRLLGLRNDNLRRRKSSNPGFALG